MCQLSGTLTGDVELQQIQGLIYSLEGTVEVGNDAGGGGTSGTAGNLIIKEGVTLMGLTDTSRLVVQRGSQINAQGTEDSPIIFTSRENVLGLTTFESFGQWGGLTLLGRAPVSNCLSGNPSNPDQDRADCELALPGFGGRFGGDAPGDNSGLLEFLQIRFAGSSAETDPAGVKLGGVGSGTTIRNVQVAHSGGDGIQVRGGKVGIFETIINEFLDDGVQTGSGYQGLMQDLLIFADRFPAEHGIEAGDDADFERLPRLLLVGNKLTVAGGMNTTGSAIELGGAGDYLIFNSVFTGFPTCLDIDNFATVRIAEPDLQELGPPFFSSTILGCDEPYQETDGDLLGLNIYFDMFDNVDDDPEMTLSDDFENGPTENAVTTTGDGIFNGIEDISQEDLFGLTIAVEATENLTILGGTFTDIPAIGSILNRKPRWACDGRPQAEIGATAEERFRVDICWFSF